MRDNTGTWLGNRRRNQEKDRKPEGAEWHRTARRFGQYFVARSVRDAECAPRLGQVALRLILCWRKALAPLAGAALLVSGCTNPSATALGTNVPLAPAP